MTPRMEYLLERVDSKFTLVTLSAMRAREINDYYNQLGEGLGKIVPPQVTSVSRKPLSIAMEEIEVGKIESVPLPTEEELAEIAAAEAAAAEAAAARRSVRRPSVALTGLRGSRDRPRRERRHRRVQGRRGLPPSRRRRRVRRRRCSPRARSSSWAR